MRVGRVVTLVLCVSISLASALWTFVVPMLVERTIGAQLARAGFSDARFTVGAVTLDRISLHDVSLGKGLTLGTVTLAAGPYRWWRGGHGDVVVSGAVIDARAMTTGAPTGTAAPFDRVIVEQSEVVSTYGRMTVRGTIDLRGGRPSLDLVATTSLLHIGSLEVVDAAASFRGPLAALHACASGRVDSARLEACATLDGANAHSATIAWEAHDPRFDAIGGGELLWDNGTPRLEHGHVEATLAGLNARGIELAPATIRADVNTDLSRQTIGVVGDLHTGQITSSRAILRDVHLPFDLDASFADGLSLHSKVPLVATAASTTVTAMGRSLRIERPVMTATGLLELPFGRISAGDEEAPFEVTAKLNNVPVAPLVAALTRDRVRATGTLDGNLVLRWSNDALSLAGSSFAAGSGGTLRATSLDEIAPSGLAVQKRIAAALSDFAYSKLTLGVDDTSTLRLTLAGRGKRVTQDISVDINVRGLLAQRGTP